MILSVLESESVALSVMLAGDVLMTRLNWSALRHRGTTDVLSFPQETVLLAREADRLTSGSAGRRAAISALKKLRHQRSPVPVLLGDIVISVPQARRQAKEQGIPLSAEIRRLIVHGVAHLLGFDHERGARAEAAMHHFEDHLLARIRE